MNIFERLLMRRLCSEAPVDGGDAGAPAADQTPQTGAEQPSGTEGANAEGNDGQPAEAEASKEGDGEGKKS